ncbi:MAG: hypothetical protein K2G51_10990 [Lachnospiraceae bacterium]|nr:hypothetical protein [Lachnospiraceae bacterium]MDE7272825.1 hypothetical protein [Lachnospiraceae bacterium]
MEEEVFNEKQQAELEEFEESQRRSYESGKRLVYLIAGLNLLLDIVSIFISHDFKLFNFIIHCALSIALIYGVTWVRYLYIVSGILTIWVTLIALPELVSLVQVSAGSGFYLLMLLLTAGYALAMVIILLFNKNVKEYLYRKKSERQ